MTDREELLALKSQMATLREHVDHLNRKLTLNERSTEAPVLICGTVASFVGTIGSSSHRGQEYMLLRLPLFDDIQTDGTELNSDYYAYEWRVLLGELFASTTNFDMTGRKYKNGTPMIAVRSGDRYHVVVTVCANSTTTEAQ